LCVAKSSTRHDAAERNLATTVLAIMKTAPHVVLLAALLLLSAATAAAAQCPPTRGCNPPAPYSSLVSTTELPSTYASTNFSAELKAGGGAQRKMERYIT
jgi:hypothetical protein